MNKLFISENNIYTSSHIMMDLSSHYKDSLAPKIELFQQIIKKHIKSHFFIIIKKGKEQCV